MSSAFNTAVTALQGFFVKLFWLGVFLPVALFASLHLLVSILTYNEVKVFVQAAATGENNWRFLGAVLGLIVLAFLLSPLLPLMRGLLDGSLLPSWLWDRLVAWRAGLVRAQRIEFQRARDDAGATRRVCGSYDARVPPAYAEGQKKTDPTNRKVLDDARTKIQNLRELLNQGRLPPAQQLDAAIEAVVKAQSTNNADIMALTVLRGTAPDATEAGLVRATSDVGDDLETLLRDARAEADGRYDAAVVRLRGIPTEAAVLPTRVADARRAAERYSEHVYGVGFTFLWPRLLMHVPSTNSVVSHRVV